MTCSENNTYTWHRPVTQFMLISLCAAEIGNKYRLCKEWAGTFLIFFFAMFRIWAYGGSRPKHSKWRCFHKQRVRYNVVFNWVVHCMEGYDHLKGKPLISAAWEQGWEHSSPTDVSRFNWETWCHRWVEFVAGSLHRGFSLVTRVFPSPQKPTFPNSDPVMYRHFWTSSCDLHGSPWVNKLHLFLHSVTMWMSIQGCTCTKYLISLYIV